MKWVRRAQRQSRVLSEHGLLCPQAANTSAPCIRTTCGKLNDTGLGKEIPWWTKTRTEWKKSPDRKFWFVRGYFPSWGFLMTQRLLYGEAPSLGPEAHDVPLSISQNKNYQEKETLKCPQNRHRCLLSYWESVKKIRRARAGGHQRWECIRNCHFLFPPLLWREVRTKPLFAILKKQLCCLFCQNIPPKPLQGPPCSSLSGS